MNYKLSIAVIAGFLPFIALGGATNIKSSASADWGSMPSPPADNVTPNQVTNLLRLKVTCRSGAVVILDRAALVEQGLRKKEGSIPRSGGGTTPPTIRLNMPDGGTVTILWDDIDKIAVGNRDDSELIYPIEITLKNGQETKIGKTYGNDNTLVGMSADGEFTIPLKEVQEIVVLPPSEMN